MIRWCAYCQEFLGEVPPFDSYELTHGMCQRCSKRQRELPSADIQRAKRLRTFHAALVSQGAKADSQEASTLIAQALDAGVRPADALIGLLAPALHELGDAWARGEVSVADEHRFTAFAESMVELVTARAKTNGTPTKPAVLLVNAEGNFHTLGVRIASLWLTERGVSTLAVYPGLPAADLAPLVEVIKPTTLGISISLSEQTPAVTRAIESLGSEVPRIVLGGHAVKQGHVPELPGITLLTDLTKLLESFVSTPPLDQPC